MIFKASKRAIYFECRARKKHNYNASVTIMNIRDENDNIKQAFSCSNSQTLP